MEFWALEYIYMEPYQCLGESESFHMLMAVFIVTSFKDMDILAHIV